MSYELIILFAAIGAIVLVIAAALIWWMNRVRSFDRDGSGALPLFGGLSNTEASAGDGVMSGGVVRMHSMVKPEPVPLAHVQPLGISSSVRTFSTIRHDVAPVMTAPAPSFAPYAPPTRPRAGNRDLGSASGAAVQAHGVAGTMIEGQMLRFSVPAEGTLQFLPGRLEIASGQDTGREIRFVRVPGPNGTEVTFGRSEGELYRHIQLHDQTVSRSHARLRFAEGHWSLCNLSQTNPVVLDGTVLPADEEQLLHDGARIEMGQVLFTFRNR